MQDDAFFRNLAHISRKSNRIFMKILAETYNWAWKSSLNYESHPEVCAVQVLVTYSVIPSDIQYSSQASVMKGFQACSFYFRDRSEVINTTLK